MQVKLYKKCILNKQYSEVFRNRGLIENYLSQLDNKTFIVDDIYIKLQGEIIVEFKADEISNNELAFDYNYIRFFANNNITYAFIDRIEFWNECVKIYYTQDVWSSTVGKWNIRESFVSNSLRIIDGEPYSKILPYENNGDININYFTNQHDGTKTFSIIFKFQLYNLTSGGDYNPIVKEAYGVFTNVIPSGNNLSQYEDDYYIDRYSLTYWLDYVARRMPQESWEYKGTKYYCRLVETYVIPCKWVDNIIQSATDFVKYNNINYNNEYCLLILPIVQTTVYEEIINANDKIISIGIFSQQIPYKFDGIDKKINITMYCTADEFHLYMALNSNLVEITKCFVSTQDYEPTTPDVLAQREIAKQQQTVKGITGIISGAVQIGVGMATAVAGGTLANSAGVASILGNTSAKITEAKGSAIEAQGVGGAVGGVMSMIEGVSNIGFANKEKYMSFNTANNDINVFFNAFYGLCYFEMLNIVNENESDNATKECGYEVGYITKNIDINNDTNNYNVLKFHFIRINGTTSEINEIISSILTNGVKIWYTSDLQEIGE